MHAQHKASGKHGTQETDSGPDALMLRILSGLAGLQRSCSLESPGYYGFGPVEQFREPGGAQKQDPTP
jgi:hypothetical protein